MAEDPKSWRGVQAGHPERQPLELNWAGGDMFGRDLLDLDEADSELLNLDGSSGEAESNILNDIDLRRPLKDRRPVQENRQAEWARTERVRLPVSSHMSSNTLAEGRAYKHPDYPPTLLELEVQALAKMGVRKLYHDPRDLEREAARAEEDRRVAAIEKFDRDRQALSPIRSRHQQQVQAPDRGDLLELQKVALSNMKGAQKSQVSTSGSASSPPRIAGGGDLLELQKVALSRMKGSPQLLQGPAKVPPPQLGGDLLELQKVALAGMAKISRGPPSSPVSEPGPQPGSGGGDLSELQRVALAKMKSNPKESSVYAMPSASQTSAPTKGPQSPTLAPRSLKQSAPGSSASPPQQASGGDLLELQKVALRNISKQPAPSPALQPAGGGDLLELQKVALRNVSKQPAPSPALQLAGGGDLLELQKVALTNIPKQPAPASSQVGGDLLELQKVALRNIPKKPAPGQVPPQVGDSLLELQKAALASMSSGKSEERKFVPKNREVLERHYAEAAGTASSLSPLYNLVPSSGPLEKLLQEISAKDLALQSANRTIEVKDELLHEYEGELANALNLLDAMNVRCTDEKEETAKVLSEAEEICGDLNKACSAIENFEAMPECCLGPQCGKGIHSSQLTIGGTTSTAAADDSHFFFGTKNGSGASQIEIDERRKLIEELLAELHNIDIARRDAQRGFELQIQKNEQLIVELQQLDSVPPVSQFEGISHIAHTEPRHYDDNKIDTGRCEHSYERLCDHAYEDPCDQAYDEEDPCNHVYKSPSDQAFANPCDHAYQDGNECGHVYQEYNGHAGFSPASPSRTVSDKQLTDALNKVESKVLAEMPTIESNHGLKPSNNATRVTDALDEVESKVLAEMKTIERNDQGLKPSNPVARVSSPDSLCECEHLEHFAQEMPSALDPMNKQLLRQLDLVELHSELENRAAEIIELQKQTQALQNALLQEQANNRKFLTEKASNSHFVVTEPDLEDNNTYMREQHDQLRQLEATLRHEREANRIEINDLHKRIHELQRQLQEQDNNSKALTNSVQVDINELEASLHAKDAKAKELLNMIAKKESAWQAEKLQMMKRLDDSETRLLVKEEEAINLTHELEISRSSSTHSQQSGPKVANHDASHFFQQQQGKEEGREILDLRCEVLSLQDCLEIKNQALKTMEKELGRSYNIVAELRSKLRGLQELERNSQKQGQSSTDVVIDRLKTKEKLQLSQSERAVMSKTIDDLSSRCKYLEKFERLHAHMEGTDDMKEQAIKELERELERNVQIIKKMQARCIEYEARAKHAEARNNLESGGDDGLGRAGGRNPENSWEQGHTKLELQLLEEKEAQAAERERDLLHYKEQIERRDQLLVQLQLDMQSQKKRQSPSPASKYEPDVVSYEPGGDGELRRSGVVFDERKSKKAKTDSDLEGSKGQTPEVSTLRELLREQWRVQKIMEDRLNTMMAYVSDRVAEFEQMTPSDAASASSLAPTTELNHFHVEAKLMKVQLEQQLQVLRGTMFTSAHQLEGAHQHQQAERVSSSDERPLPSNLLNQNMQLLVEKIALENSAHSLQEKTSRLLNKLTSMRSEFGESVAASDFSR